MNDLDCHYSGLPSVKSYDMKQQTAVEWLYDQITRTSWDYNTVKQAKVMEKQQISEAYRQGVEEDVYNNPLKTGDEYYDEKYNSSK
jgi:hypothetical protein